MSNPGRPAVGHYSLRRARGRTVIELLVSIALGLLILLGVGSLYLGSSQSSRASVNGARLEESAVGLMTLLGSSMRRAGYSEIVGQAGLTRQTTFLYSGPHIRGCTNGRFANIAAGDFGCVPGTAADGDTVAVWFQGDSRRAAPQAETLDCLGNAPPPWNVTGPLAGAVATIPLIRNVYYLDGFADANGPHLMCLGNGSNAPQRLMSGVEQFKVYYGFDDRAVTTTEEILDQPTARSVRDASFVMAPAQQRPGSLSVGWDFVVSVHVCVVLRSQEAGVRASAGTDFVPCPADAAAAASASAAVAGPADGALRRSYNQSFTLRSRATPAPLT